MYGAPSLAGPLVLPQISEKSARRASGQEPGQQSRGDRGGGCVVVFDPVERKECFLGQMTTLIMLRVYMFISSFFFSSFLSPQFQKLAHIYGVLGDDSKRAYYDRFGPTTEGLQCVPVDRGLAQF